MSSRKRSSRRAAICSTGIVRSRAAASSIASGRPSSRRQISATAGCRSEAGRDRAGAIEEQLDRGIVAERRDRDEVLARDRQRLAAGRDDPQARAGAEQRVGQRRGGADQVLAVVEAEDRLAVEQHVDQPLEPVARRRARAVEHGALAQAERGQRGGHDLDLGGDRRELDHPHAAVDAVHPARERLAGEPRLARRRPGRRA